MIVGNREEYDRRRRRPSAPARAESAESAKREPTGPGHRVPHKENDGRHRPATEQGAWSYSNETSR